MSERKAYPTFITEDKGVYLVYIPDLDLYTEGKDMEEAICMARDIIGSACVDWEDVGRELPKASSYDEARKKAKENTEVFDYSKGILTLVDVNVDEFRRKIKNQSVKKNCTIPYWLAQKAEEAGVNFSRILQDALCKELKL